MLVVALVRSDEGVGRNVTGGEVGEESGGAIEGNGVLEGVPGVVTFLHVLEVGEGVVLDGVEKGDAGGGKGRVQSRGDLGEVGQVREVAVAVVDEVSTGDREALLVALVGLAGCNELVGDGLAYDVGVGRVGLDAVGIVVARSPVGLVGWVNGGGGGAPA